jgi:Tfp pilus assembly protein PilP
MQGKRRAPGAPAPEKPAVAVPAPPVKSVFTVERDPFKQPTEILPTECPPSLPLCRFDRSQLKLVGVIQVGEGELRGMVEDPDGRGYFVGTGMQIGGATITQVTAKGMVLHDHRTRQDIAMPLFREAREGMEF